MNLNPHCKEMIIETLPSTTYHEEAPVTLVVEGVCGIIPIKLREVQVTRHPGGSHCIDFVQKGRRKPEYRSLHKGVNFRIVDGHGTIASHQDHLSAMAGEDNEVSEHDLFIKYTDRHTVLFDSEK